MSSPLELIVSFVTFAVIMAVLSRSKGPKLALQKLTLLREPRARATPTIEIVGRSRGIIAFILTTMGFSATTRFTVTDTEIRYESTSLSGQRSQVIPLRQVATLGAGVHKPVIWLMGAGFIFLMTCAIGLASGELLVLAIGIIVAAVLIVVYFLAKSLFIEVQATSGQSIPLHLVPSVLDGVPIDVDEALAVISVIRDIVDHDTGSGAVSRVTSSPALQEVPAAELPSMPPPAAVRARSAPATPVNDEVDAKAAFVQAKQLFESGQRELGIQALESLIERYPNTTAAFHAQRNLERLVNSSS